MPKRPSASTLFSSISELESSDVVAAKKQRIVIASSIAKSKALKSQSNLQAKLIEIRILLQQGLKETSPGNNNENDISATDELLQQLLIARSKLPSNADLPPPPSVTESSSSDLNSHLEKEYQHHRTQWKEALDKRHADLRLRSGYTRKADLKFKVMDSTFWDQVEATVAHETLLRNSSEKEEKDYFTSHFDDTKVYQHMLKSFITHSSSGVAGEGGVSKSRTLQNKKNKVDRKASKGRKIRYTVHPKMTNFTFPIKRPERVVEEEEWFRSLFGGVANAKKE